MTGAVLDTMDYSADQVEHAINGDENETSSPLPLPTWVHERRASWGEELHVAEWEHHDTDPHRHKNGWEVRFYSATFSFHGD
jgi:hypothetical protein